MVSVYQDDGVFGLDFTDRLTPKHALPSHDQGSLRSRRRIPLAHGPIRSVEVVYDTTVEGGRSPGLVTEALMHTRARNAGTPVLAIDCGRSTPLVGWLP